LDTQQEPIVCAVCGRSLLRGELANTFLDGSSPRQVCELCTARAAHYGWRREGVQPLRDPRARGERTRSLVGRWRGGATVRPDEPVSADAPFDPAPPPPPAERRIHAIPTGEAQRAQRAVELFNRSEHPRTIAGVGRSLGAPFVYVDAVQTGTAVGIVVAWELCWYRYVVDLEDDVHGVRLLEQGDELAELGDTLGHANAAAGERGELALVPDAE
jgi:hypothetical protein